MTPQNQKLRDVVEDMLLDAGEEDSGELRDALMSLGALAALPAPAPNAQLAALLAAPQDELTRRRGLRRHRTTIAGLAVVAGMGLGATGVAASSTGFGDPAHPPIRFLLQEWAPAWSVTGLALLTADGLLREPAAGNQPDPASVPAGGPGEGPGDHGAAQDAAGRHGADGNGPAQNGPTQNGQIKDGPTKDAPAGKAPGGVGEKAEPADGAQGKAGNASPHGSTAGDPGVHVPGTLTDPLTHASGAQEMLPPAAPAHAGSGRADSGPGSAARLLGLQGR